MKIAEWRNGGLLTFEIIVKKILAVASFGGHWIQLRRLSPLFDRYRTTYVSTEKMLKRSVAPNKFYDVVDAAKETKLKLVWLCICALYILIRVRPDVVITTGAAPGLVFLVLGKVLGSKTIWLDSIANAEELSLSGKLAKRWADLWLTQWCDVADRTGASYIGRVL